MFNDPDRLISSTERIGKNIKVVAREKGGDGGLPDASGYKDGTALISVGGKFIPIEGYAYIKDNNQLDLSWDCIYHADDPNMHVINGVLLYKMSEKSSDYIPNAVITLSVLPYVPSMVLNETPVMDGLKIYQPSDGPQIRMYWIDNAEVWSQMGTSDFGVGLFLLHADDPIIEDGENVFAPRAILRVTAKSLNGVSKMADDYINAKLEFKVVNILPNVGENGIIYLIQNSDGDSLYDEYVWIASDSRFEKLGPRQIDISGKVDKTSIMSGTTEYEDGVTDLPTGALYFQYEV